MEEKILPVLIIVQNLARRHERQVGLLLDGKPGLLWRWLRSEGGNDHRKHSHRDKPSKYQRK